MHHVKMQRIIYVFPPNFLLLSSFLFFSEACSSQRGHSTPEGEIKKTAANISVTVREQPTIITTHKKPYRVDHSTCERPYSSVHLGSKLTRVCAQTELGQSQFLGWQNYSDNNFWCSATFLIFKQFQLNCCI